MDKKFKILKLVKNFQKSKNWSKISFFSKMA